MASGAEDSQIQLYPPSTQLRCHSTGARFVTSRQAEGHGGAGCYVSLSAGDRWWGQLYPGGSCCQGPPGS